MKKKPKPAAKKDVKKRGLPVKPMANLDKVNLLSELGSGLVPRTMTPLEKPKPGILSPQRIKQIPSVLTTETTDQAELAKAGDAATVLLANDKFSKLIGAMIGFRQAYALCYRELQEYIAQVQTTWPEGQPFPMVEDFLVQYAAYQSAKPFTEHTLMSGMMQTILPWMADIIDAHSKEDENTNRQARSDAEQARRKLPIAIGCKHTPYTEEATLVRDRSLILVGWRNVVLWVVDQICDYNGKLSMTGRDEDGVPAMTVRFMETAPKVKEQSHTLVRIGGNAWKQCADSDKKLALCMGEYVADKLSSQIDLLICDQLSSAIAEGFVGRADGARAGDAHKRFRKWCDSAGAAFIGCVCRDTREEIDILDPMFEQLRTFTFLREVSVTENGDEYRVVLGNSATVWSVKKEELDGYGSRLVLPAQTIEA